MRQSNLRISNPFQNHVGFIMMNDFILKKNVYIVPMALFQLDNEPEQTVYVRTREQAI